MYGGDGGVGVGGGLLKSAEPSADEGWLCELSLTSRPVRSNVHFLNEEI